MTEENKENAEEQVVSQEQVVVEQEASRESPPNVQEENWKRANEALKLQKQRIEELETRITQQAQQVPEEPDEFDKLDPDEYLTVSKARLFAEKLAEKKAAEITRKEMEKYIQQQNVANDEERARTKYEDYDYVIENYALPMIKNDPALAYKIQSSKNPAEIAYKLGKLSDEYEEANMPKNISPKAEKVLKNTSRPLSSATASPNLKTQADTFSNMTKEQIWAESQKYARRG